MTTASPSVITLLAHPTRRAVLRVFQSDVRSRRSPKDLAERLGLPMSDVSYHVRVLAKGEALSLAGTRRVRGATQHFYERGPAMEAHEQLFQMMLAAETPPGGGSSPRGR